MRTLFTFLLSLISLASSAIEIDSVKRREIIREGQSELCNLIEYNSHVADPLQKKFLVLIDGNEAPINYTTEKHIDNANDPILSAVTIDSINLKIAATYVEFGIEMYVIMMKSFDVIVPTPLSANPTARDLFQTKLYDEQSNIAVLRAQHSAITQEIINTTFSARGRSCMIYSRAVYTGTLVPGKAGTWELAKKFTYNPNQPTYNDLNELCDYFHERTKNNTNVTEAGYENALCTVAREFYESAKFIHLKAAILTTYTSSGMSAIFAQFNNQSINYQSLTEPERIHALAVFSGYSMNDNGLYQEERYAVKIIKYTPPDQVEDLLEHLTQESPMHGNQNYQGLVPNEALICTLIREIDDAGTGENNYAELMRSLTSIALSDRNFALSHLPQTSQQWYDRRIYWDDWSLKPWAAIGTHDYDVTLFTSGSVGINRKVVKQLIEETSGRQDVPRYTSEWATYEQYTLNPFDLVVFTNRSSLGMLQIAGAAQNQPFLAPAIFVKYADDKAFNANAITTTAIALDIAAIVLGPTSIIAAVEAGNAALCAFECLQFLGAGTNLAANTSGSQEFQDALNTFNTIVGIWGLARITVSGARYTASYIAAGLDGTIQKIPMPLGQQYCTEYDNINSWANVDAPTQDRMAKLRQFLGEQVDAGELITFIAHTGEELRVHLNSLVNPPPAVSYTGSTYRTIGINYNNPLDIHPGSIAADYRYSPPGHGGLYLSETYNGNVTEMSHYSQGGVLHNCKTYGYQDVHLSNLLDLTDPYVRQTLGVDFDMLTLHNGNNTLENYVFTHEIGLWAETRYDGIMFPGARGNADYTNIVVFQQQTVDAAFVNIQPTIVIHE